MHQGTRNLGICVMLLVLCKLSFGTITKILGSRSVWFTYWVWVISLNYSQDNEGGSSFCSAWSTYVSQSFNFARLYLSVEKHDGDLGWWGWVGSMFPSNCSLHWECKIFWWRNEDYTKCQPLKRGLWGLMISLSLFSVTIFNITVFQELLRYDLQWLITLFADGHSAGFQVVWFRSQTT